MKNQSQEEIWKDIKGYEGLYQISNLGRVKGLRRFYYDKNGRRQGRKENILKPFISRNNPYYTVRLYKNCIGKLHKIHILVWDTFSNEKRDGQKLQIDHHDNNKGNNFFTNLKLVTNRTNTSKAKAIGRDIPTGVYFNKSRNKYQAQITYNKKVHSLGRYDDMIEASRAYQNALCKLGEAA